MPSYSRNALLTAAGLAIAALGIAVALWPKPLQVDLAAVTLGPMSVTVDEEGRTRIKDIYTVSAPIAGQLRRIAIEVGDRVEAGRTELAVIEPSLPPFLDARTRAELRANLDAANAAVAVADADLDKAQSELSFAEDDLERAQRLARTGTIPERRLDEAEHRAEAARMTRNAAEAVVNIRQRERDALLARLNDDASAGNPTSKCCVVIKAPASGRVLTLVSDSERDVAAGTPLLQIGDPANLEIVVELLSSEAVQVAEGATVDIEDWGGAVPLRGTVSRIEPSGFTKVSALGIEEQRVKVLIALVGPPAAHARLGHDYRVFARIASWSSDVVLRVPVAALFRAGTSWAVYRVEAAKARVVPIEIGHRNGELAEVLSGLDPGDKVILHPSDQIADGVRVRKRQSG